MTKNIVVWNATTRERWEFIQTRDLDGSSLRLRRYVRPDARWSLTAVERLSGTQCRPADLQETHEEPNSMLRPDVPDEVAAEACNRAGAGAKHKAWDFTIDLPLYSPYVPSDAGSVWGRDGKLMPERVS